MKELRQKFMTVLTLALTMGSVFPYSIIGTAATDKQEDKIEITKATLTAGGNELSETNQIEKGAEITVTLDWQSLENTLFEEEERFSFALPDTLTYSAVSDGKLTGNAGTYTMDPKTNLLEMTFAKNYSENADTGMAEQIKAYGGTIKLAAKTNSEAIDNETVTFKPGMAKTIYYMEESSDDDSEDGDGQQQPEVKQPVVVVEQNEELKKDDTTDAPTVSEPSDPTPAKPVQVAPTGGIVPFGFMPADLYTGVSITTIPGADKYMSVAANGELTLFNAFTLKKLTNGNWETVTSTTPMKVGDTVMLEYGWEIDDDFKKLWKEKDFFEFQLPAFLNVTTAGSGDFTSNGLKYGSYTLTKDGKVKITFSDNTFKKSGIDGTFEIGGKVKEYGDPGSGDITIPFVDEAVNDIPPITIPSKTGLAKAVGTNNIKMNPNGTTIDWVIKVNRTNETLPAGSLLTDTLPPGTSYVDDSFEILSYPLNLTTGNPDYSNPRTVAGDEYDFQAGAMTVKFEKDTAYYYEIKFTTNVDNIEDAIRNGNTASYINNVKLTRPGKTELNAHAEAKLYQDSKVTKKVGTIDYNKGTVEYEIDFVLAEGVTIPAGAILKDVMDYGQLICKSDGTLPTASELTNCIKVTNTNGGNLDIGLQVTKDANKTGEYEFKVTKPITESFKLKYLVKFNPANTSTVRKNTVTWGGSGTGQFVPRPDSGIVKNYANGTNPSSNNYQKDTIDWVTYFNTAKIAIDSWSITDTMTGGMKMTDTSSVKLQYSTDTKGYTDTTKTWTDVPTGGYLVQRDSDTSFKVSSTSSLYDENATPEIPKTAVFKLTYTTEYDNERGPSGKKQRNTAGYTYTINTFNYSGSSYKEFTVPAQTKLQAGKSGAYNGAREDGVDEITWTINLNTGTDRYTYTADDTFTDAVPAGLTYKPGSFKILDADDNNSDVTSEFTIKPAGYDTPGANPRSFTVTGFPAGEKTKYQIVMVNTIDKVEKDGVMVTPNGTATNKAIFTDANKRVTDPSASVSYHQDSEFIKKTSQKITNPISQLIDQVDFRIEINPDTAQNPAGANKRVLKNVVVKDEQSTNLKLQTGSVKVFNRNGSEFPKAGYELKESLRGFEIIFSVDITDMIYLTYSSDVEKVVGEATNLTNKATIKGENFIGGKGESNQKIDAEWHGGTMKGITGRIVLYKKDNATPPNNVSGARFEIFEVDDNDKVKQPSIDFTNTDGNGNIFFEDLMSGKYRIFETATSDGHVFDPNSPEAKGIDVTLKVKEGTKEIEDYRVDVINNQTGNIKLVKTDGESNAKLPGAVFELYEYDKQKETTGNKVTLTANGKPFRDSNGEITETFTTDANGEIFISNLAPGWYVFKEIQAPTNYEPLSGPTVAKEVKSDNTATVFTRFDVENQTVKSEISLHKTGLHGKTSTGNLKDAEFALYDVTSGKRNQVGAAKKTNVSGIVNFDKLEAGKIYQIEEETAPVGYTGKVVIANIQVDQTGKVTYGAENTEFKASTPVEVTNDLEVTEINGTKTWKLEGNDADFVMPTSITVTLKQMSGKDVENANFASQTVTPDPATNAWSYTFKDLPKYDLKKSTAANKVEYTYEVVETPVVGFDSEAEGNDLVNTVITKDINGTKTWDALAKKYNVIPNQDILISLMYKQVKGTTDADWKPFQRGGQALTATINVNQSDYSFTKLPTHEKGKEVEYKVVEAAVNGFEAEANEYDIHNRMETTEISVIKNWNDLSDHYDQRPAHVTFTLLKKAGNDWTEVKDNKGQVITIDVTGLKSTNQWTGTFSDLPKYDSNGDLMEYAVREDVNAVTTGVYSLQGDEKKPVNQDGTVVFENGLNTVSIEVGKAWSDFDNKFGSRPTRVSFEIRSWPSDGVSSITALVKTPTYTTGIVHIPINADGTSDTVVIDKLPLMNKFGVRLNYVVKEVEIAANYNQTPTYTGNDSSLTIINTLPTTQITVDKTWDDKGHGNDQRPEAEFELFRTEADGTVNSMFDLFGTEYKATISGSELLHDTWSHDFVGLPKFDQTGFEYIYTVKENILGNIGNYSTQQNGSAFINTRNTVDVEGIKTWDDAGNQDGKRPATITVQLLQNGQEMTGFTKVVSPDSQGAWAYEFTGLPEADNTGTNYVYTIKEVDVPTGYTSTVDGMNVVNEYTPETVEIGGTKYWIDENNHFENRPDEIYLHLVKSTDGQRPGITAETAEEEQAALAAAKVAGSEITVQVDKKAQNQAYNWDHMALPKYEGGKELSYFVVEEKVALYGTGYLPGPTDVTNRHEKLGDSFPVPVIKNWADGNDAYELRPESVTFILIYKGTDGDREVTRQSVQANPEGNFTHTFNLNLIDYPNGTDASNFEIKEEAVFAYDVDEVKFEEGQFTVTNKLKTIDVKGTKTWDDADNQDGKRPTSIKVQLLQNGQAITKGEYAEPLEVTADEAGNWSYEFKALPEVDENGEAYDYSVAEVAVPEGYNSKVDTKDPMNLTNSYIPEETTHKVVKKWDDAKDNDGKRPEAIQVQLFADGEAVGEAVTLNAKNDWQHEWKQLAKFADGKEIVYEAKELLTDADKEFYEANHVTKDNETIITNAHTEITIKPTVTKEWDDSSNAHGLRPKDITIKLYADNKVIDTVTFKGTGDTWSYKFEALPKYKEGKEIQYTVTEEAVNGYSTTITNEAVDFTIINKVKLTEASGKKTWKDYDDQDGLRPKSIKVQLLQNGKAYRETTAEEEGNWTYTFDNLPVEDAKGTEYTYTVKEVEVPAGYDDAYDGMDITNTHIPEIISIPIKKQWHDNNDAAGIRPDRIKVLLIANGDEENPVSEESFSGVGNDWSTSFDNLPTKENGKPIEYSVKEVPVPGYETRDITSDGGHGFVIDNDLKTIELKGKKTWVDGNNQDGLRPKSIKVQLLQNDKPMKYGNYQDPQEVTEEDWTYTFENLPEMDREGKDFKYTVKEVAVPTGYDDTYDGMNITNTHTPEKIDIPVTKNWDDNSNAQGLRSTNITIKLYADNKVIETVTFKDKGDTWNHKFEALPKYKDGGKEINYTVTEEAVNGYSTTITNEGYEFTIVNKVKLTEVSGEKTWEDNDNQDGLRPGSIEVQLLQNDKEYGETKEVKPAEDGTWTYTFDNLPLEDKEGKAYTYTVEEAKVPTGYTSEAKGMNITNTRIPAIINIPIKKVWVDDSDAAKLRPTEIKVQLFAGKETEPRQELTITGTGNTWNHIFENLPAYEDGKLIEYSVKEIAVKGYKTTIKGDALKGYTITNTVERPGLPTTGGSTTTTTRTTLPQTGSELLMWMPGLGLALILVAILGYGKKRRNIR